MEVATDLKSDPHTLKLKTVTYYESTPVDPARPMGKILNGFARVTLGHDEVLEEAYFDELGNSGWSWKADNQPDKQAGVEQ